MSALGQKQTFGLRNAMSALPPKADMAGNSSGSLAIFAIRRAYCYGLSTSCRIVMMITKFNITYLMPITEIHFHAR